MTKQAFFALVAPLAQKEAAQRKAAGKKWILPSICIAQAACESGWATSKKMVKANALFGIKVGKNKVRFGSAWKGSAYSTKTNECYDGKTYTQITDLFRAYDSVADAVTDYFDMLTSASRYAAACCVEDARACITAIKNGGYATSPTYISTIMSIVNTNNLTQYDSVVTDAQQNAPSDATAAAAANFKVGKVYTLQANMYVRYKAAGDKKPYSQLTANGKLHAYKDSQGFGILRKGTRVTCKGVSVVDGAVWIDIPSGTVCARAKEGKVYAA